MIDLYEDHGTSGFGIVALVMEAFVEEYRGPLEYGTLGGDTMRATMTAHAGQIRDEGSPFLVHPLRVATRTMRRYPSGVLSLGVTREGLGRVGLAHDVLEDGPERLVTHRFLKGTPPMAKNLLRRTLSADEFEAVEALTKVSGEPNAATWARVGSSPLAVLVKVEDRLDNLLTMGPGGWASNRRAQYLVESALGPFALISSLVESYANDILSSRDLDDIANMIRAQQELGTTIRRLTRKL